MMVEYDIDFATIIRYKIQERDFTEMITMLFPCLVLRIYDNPGVLDMYGVDDRLQVTSTAQIKTMKDPARPTLPRRPSEPFTIPQAQIEVLSISTELSNVQREKMEASIDFEIGK